VPKRASLFSTPTLKGSGNSLPLSVKFVCLARRGQWPSRNPLLMTTFPVADFRLMLVGFSSDVDQRPIRNGVRSLQ
jgi:hypothetical protein